MLALLSVLCLFFVTCLTQHWPQDPPSKLCADEVYPSFVDVLHHRAQKGESLSSEVIRPISSDSACDKVYGDTEAKNELRNEIQSRLYRLDKLPDGMVVLWFEVSEELLLHITFTDMSDFAQFTKSKNQK